VITGSIAKAEPISDKVKITIETSYDYYIEAAQLLMASKSRGEKIVLMPEQTSIITETRDYILKGLLEQMRLLTVSIEKELEREKTSISNNEDHNEIMAEIKEDLKQFS